MNFHPKFESIFFFAPIFLALFVLTSCSKDGTADPELSLSFEQITFSGVSNSNVLMVDANTDWQAEVSDSWITLSQSAGSTGTSQIKLTITQNNTVSVRTGTITFVAGSLSKVVTITQRTNDLILLSQSEISLSADQADINLTVQSSTSDFTYTIPDWISLKSVSSDKTSEVFTVSENQSYLTRTGYMIYTAGTYKDTVTVTQTGKDLTIASDNSGVTSNAMTLYSKMGIGWNLGNALESCSSSTSASETSWGNPKTTQALIDAVKAAGFNTVRIPCAWSGYIEDQSTYRIKDSWLARVKEVVDYCINDGLYVVLNSHWDGGWRDDSPYYSTQVAVNAKHKAIWQQIAVYFRDYDEHLIFAGTNEVGVNLSGTPTAENLSVQKSYNQVFVDAVRATGGKNTYRNLLVQAYATNIAYANTYMTMPTDATSNRLMAEVHFYDPWDYCGLEADASWGNVIYYWGKEAGYDQYGTISSWGQEDWVREEFGLMKTKFVDNNIPVVMGEYGAIYRTGTSQANLDASRNYYLNYVTKEALAYGIVPVYWDNGATGNLSFGLFDRSSGAQVRSSAINAIISAGN